MACGVTTPAFSGEGVSGVLKGCAAEVEVAAGGCLGESGLPCRGADCVAALTEMGLAA